MTDQSPTPEQAAEAAARAFIDAFNAQDHIRLAATLHYPHVRLAGGRFTSIASAEEFILLSRTNAPRLVREGWHHTELAEVRVVHSGPDKVHLALTVDRCREDGSVYNRFETLWIATRRGGHWGIQFRSSYLATPTNRGRGDQEHGRD